MIYITTKDTNYSTFTLSIAYCYYGFKIVPKFRLFGEHRYLGSRYRRTPWVVPPNDPNSSY